MDYAKAKTIFDEVSPNLTLEPDSGHAHIVVRKNHAPGQPPFSIMLPDVAHTMVGSTPEEIADSERKLLLDALAAAQR